MKMLTVFYDAKCGMCRAIRRWMTSRPAYIHLRFIALQSERAREVCPDIDRFEPEREIVVMGDGGEIYVGGKAWVMCMWALKEYRGLSMKMGSPVFLPLAKRICHLVSKNRIRLSRWFFWRSAGAVEQQLEKEETDLGGNNCATGACGLPAWNK